jgi:ribonuclease HII
MVPADWEIETQLWQAGLLVAGVDEAGRGPLAGPVVAAAVIFPSGCALAGLDDSKKLTATRRNALFPIIQQHARAFCWAVVEVDYIDRHGILRATFEAMRQAVAGLACQPDHLLVDGRQVPPAITIPAQAVVRGDGKSSSIAAASIVAKVVRDGLMCQLHEQFPQYGFNRHKGYAAPAHLEALAQHGPCPCHRRSFAPIRETKLEF